MKNEEAEYRILVVFGGWVYVGEVERAAVDYVIRRGFNVRRWDVNKGLGDIAHRGPQASTVLDPINLPIEISSMHVLSRQHVNVDAWRETFATLESK